jgi:hypothetical protein
MVSDVEKMWTLADLIRECDAAPQTVKRRIAAGLLKPDARTIHGTLLFRESRIPELRRIFSETLSRPATIAIVIDPLTAIPEIPQVQFLAQRL